VGNEGGGPGEKSGEGMRERKGRKKMKKGDTPGPSLFCNLRGAASSGGKSGQEGQMEGPQSH